MNRTGDMLTCSPAQVQNKKLKQQLKTCESCY